MSAATDIESALNDVALALDTALPTLGYGELVPLVNLVTQLGAKLAEAVAEKQNASQVLATEVQAADAAADAAEDAKFPPGKP